MTLDASFSVEGSSAIVAHAVAYGATVDLAALSTEFRTIEWVVVATSKADLVAPTITRSGAPTGATASFPWITDPGDTLGRAIAVACIQTDSQGQQAIAYRIIGTANSQGRIPLVAGEEVWRSATHGWTETVNEALDASGVGGGSSGSVIPAPALVATSNIALTGNVTVDGVDTNTLAANSMILATAQTAPAQNGPWIKNDAGAWTRPSYYSSDATVAAALGQTSGAALGGVLNIGQTYYQLTGATIAGSKSFVLTQLRPDIYANAAPWFMKGDGTDETATRDALTAYALTFPLGCTLRFGPGTYAFSTPWRLTSGYINIVGAGFVATTFTTLGTTPFDNFEFHAELNVGRHAATCLQACRVVNATIKATTAKWASASSALTQGAYYIAQATNPHCNTLLLTTKSGSTGARPPIGELTCSNTVCKMIGTANAAGQFVIKLITAGALGVMQVQVSADAGQTWGATQNTVAGDYHDIVVDTAIGGSVYGASCKIRIANIPSFEIDAGTLDAFTMPAVRVDGSVTGQVTVTLLTGTTTVMTGRLNSANAWVYVAGAGLMHVDDVVDPTHMILSNVGAAGSAAPTTAIGSGAAWTAVVPPSPRIEVLGTPPSDDYVVDVLPSPGPLGRVMSFWYGRGVATGNKHKFGLSVSVVGGYPAGGITTVDGPYFDYAIPATSLTIRVHAGILGNNTTWMYMTPTASWSMQEGTTVADGSNIWTITKGPACVRLNGAGGLILRDVSLDGGLFNLVVSQAEGVVLEGNIELKNSASAQVWLTNGDGRFGESGGFTNSNAVLGNVVGRGSGWGIIHDGGFGFTLGEGYSNSSSPMGWAFIAGLIGGTIEPLYLEGVGQGKQRNAQYFSRISSGGNASRGITFRGYWGSLSSSFPSAFDFYNGESITVDGVTFGQVANGLTGCNSLTNSVIRGCTHMQGYPIWDAVPAGTHDYSSQGVSSRRDTETRPTSALSFANGANVAIAAPYADYDITGPTAVFSADGFIAGTSGQRLKIRNRTAYAWTINHEAGGASATRRILTPAGAAVTVPTGGTAEFEYSTTDSRWVLISVSLVCAPLRVATGTTDAIIAADLGANVQYTNGAGCAITLNTMPAGFSCLVSAEAAAALTFANGTATLETAIAGNGATTAQYQARFLFWRTATNVRIT